MQCHLIGDGVMCSHPPVGAQIVLFLSESPLIFYYTIKSICSTHKQLEIKWAPLKGLWACVHVCVWLWTLSPPKGQDEAIYLQPVVSIQGASFLHKQNDALLSLKCLLLLLWHNQPSFTGSVLQAVGLDIVKLMISSFYISIYSFCDIPQWFGFSVETVYCMFSGVIVGCF